MKIDNNYLLATEQGWECPSGFVQVQTEAQCLQASNLYAQIVRNTTGGPAALVPKFVPSQELVSHLDVYFDKGLTALMPRCVVLPENSAVDLPTHQWTEGSWVWNDPRFIFNPIDVDEFGSRLAVTRREHAETQFGNTTFGFAVCTKTQHLTSNATNTDEWYKLAMAQLDSLVARPVTISTGKSHKQSFQVSLLLVGLSSQLMQTTTQADQLRQLLLSTLRQALPPSAVTRVDMIAPNFADRRLLATEGLIVSVNVTLPREDTTTAYTQLMAMVADSGVAGLAQQMRAADALDASPLGMSAVLESTMVILEALPSRMTRACGV